MENEGHRELLLDEARVGTKRRGDLLPPYLTLPALFFFSCSSRRARSCSSAMAISSSMLVISSLALRRFSYKLNTDKWFKKKNTEMFTCTSQC